MPKTVIPAGYRPALGLYDTQKAIGLIKQIFLEKLCGALHLKRVTAPLFVDPATGLNDDLNGVERPVTFDVPALGANAEVVHSLAKWKRMALAQYDFHGATVWSRTSNAIRRDEEMDNLHSIYVEQWDWEKVITREERTTEYLKQTVQKIVDAVCGTLDETYLKWQFPALERVRLCRETAFATARSWRTNGLRSHQRKGKMLLQRRTARCSSSASAGRCVPAGLTTAARRTMTTGR